MAEKQIIINAERGVLGRISVYAAKQALKGNKVVVVNCNKAIITGNKKDIVQKYKTLRDKGGHSLKGPRVSKFPHFIVRRSIKGMLPDFRRGSGKVAYLKVRCYDDTPEEYKDKEMVNFKTLKNKYIELEELSSKL